MTDVATALSDKLTGYGFNPATVTIIMTNVEADPRFSWAGLWTTDISTIEASAQIMLWSITATYAYARTSGVNAPTSDTWLGPVFANLRSGAEWNVM